MGFSQTMFPTAMDRERRVAGRLWVLPLVEIGVVLVILVFAGVVAGSAMWPPGSLPDKPDPNAAVMLLVLTGVHAASPLLWIVVCRVQRFFACRTARRLAQTGADPEAVEGKAAMHVWQTTILRTVGAEAIASVGLIVCLVTAILHEEKLYFLNALCTPPAIVWLILTFSTRKRREQTAEQFRRMVRQEQHLE